MENKKWTGKRKKKTTLPKSQISFLSPIFLVIGINQKWRIVIGYQISPLPNFPLRNLSFRGETIVSCLEKIYPEEIGEEKQDQRTRLSNLTLTLHNYLERRKKSFFNI